MSSPAKSARIMGDLSPEARLQPEKEKPRHNHDHDFHRRRRRANKRGRRQRGGRDWSSPERSGGGAGHGASSSSSSAEAKLVKSSRASSLSGKNSSHSHHHQSHLHRRPGQPPKNSLVLRPTKGPLLNAPKNSTQFIIDDHETSPFLDGTPPDQQQEDSSPKKYNTRSRQASSSSSRRVSASEEAFSPAAVEAEKSTSALDKNMTSSEAAVATSGGGGGGNNSLQATPGNYVVNDDDYTLWAEFSERDFQTVYESAHQEQVADWDRHRLIEEISTLERRQKELVAVLAKVDPEMYAQRLQEQLETLQEKNRILRNELPSSEAAGAAIANDAKKSPRKSPDSSTKEL
jgi:hypothetical protein